MKWLLFALPLLLSGCGMLSQMGPCGRGDNDMYWVDFFLVGLWVAVERMR